MLADLVRFRTHSTLITVVPHHFAHNSPPQSRLSTAAAPGNDILEQHDAFTL